MTGMPIDSASVRALAARLDTPERVIVPVRHHSPACAWQLKRWMEAHRPGEVLVEGPRSFDPLVPLLVHPEAVMPLAVYSYQAAKGKANADPRRRAAYFPLCDYSPELVALRSAHALGIPCHFIDLEFHEQGQVDRAGGHEESPVSLLDERRYRQSAHLGLLASRLGCRDSEELWEQLFEMRSADTTFEAHTAALLAWCQLARQDCDADLLARDGTLQREAEMAWQIRQAMQRRAPGAGPILVVVGGLHAVALPDLLDRPDLARPVVADAGTPASETVSTLIRYNYERLDQLNGYAAGMTSPAWHQQLWQRMLDWKRVGDAGSIGGRRALVLELLQDIADELRSRHGLQLPLSALSGAYQQALALAALRQRPAPARNDVLDAVLGNFVKGDADTDGALILEVARRRLCGQAYGRVPPGAGRPPLVRDFELRARRQRLKIDASGPRELVLDLYRRPGHRETSRLLHGLHLLAVPFGIRTSGPDFIRALGLERLQERWEYDYTVAVEAALVEAGRHGATVEEAVAARFEQRLREAVAGGSVFDALRATAFMTHACVLGLHEQASRIGASLRQAIAADAAFESVATASVRLALLWVAREPLEARTVEDLPKTVGAAFERAVYLGYDLQQRRGDLSAAVSALQRLRELLGGPLAAGLDPDLYWALIDALSAQAASALLRGAATGLAFGAGRYPAARLARALQGHLDGWLIPAEAMAFLRGLMQTARELAWQSPDVMAVLDHLIRTWSEGDFIANLPELRMCFAGMTPRETDRIAQAVAALHGESELATLVHSDVSAEQVQDHLRVHGELLDLLRADGLGDWIPA